MHISRILHVFAPALALAVSAGPALGQSQMPDTGAGVRYRDDAVVVVLTPAAAERARAQRGDGVEPSRPAELDRTAAALGARLEPEFTGLAAFPAQAPNLSRFWVARLPAGTDVEAAMTSLRAAADVEQVSRIAIVPVVGVPNDSLWGVSYHFQQPSRRDLHAAEAWDVETGDPSRPIAVLDTGVLPWHPDLGGSGGGGNLWSNTAEVAGTPGVDDDGNGYVDDVAGWDFVDLDSVSRVQPGEDWRDEDNDPNDFAAHGTAVAGVIGALSNNLIGVAGTVPAVRLLPLRVGWSAALAASGEVDMSYVARAIVYAAQAGAGVANCSFSTITQPDLLAAVDVAHAAGMCLVVAAGNNGTPHYLSLQPDIISVAATDADDRLTRFSNRGSYVDVAAPGLSIATTSFAKSLGADSLHLRQPEYTTGASGTSFAAPLVAGAVALVQAHRLRLGLPPLSAREMELRLSDTADDISDMNPGFDAGYGAGRVNYLRALTDPRGSYTLGLHGATAGTPAAFPARNGGTLVVMATAAGQLDAVDGETGAVVWSKHLPQRPAGGVAAAEIAPGLGHVVFVALAGGWIAGYDESGLELPGWPVVTSPVQGPPTLEPALADLDGDGRIEVAWPGSDGSVCAWNLGGTPLPGFPVAAGPAIGSGRIALADLDGIAGSEIITMWPNGRLSCVRSTGMALPGWPRFAYPEPLAPVVAPLGERPAPCVVTGFGNRVFAFARDGSTRWQRDLGTPLSGWLAAVDLDRDGRFEILAGIDGGIAVLDSGGVVVDTLPIPSRLGNSVGVTSVQEFADTPMPALGFFAEGRPGVVVTVRGVLYGLHADGRRLPGFPRYSMGGTFPCLFDLDGDDRTEVVAGARFDGTVYAYSAGPGVWTDDLHAWPTHRGNAARTGSARYVAPPLPPPTDHLPPAKIVDLVAEAQAPDVVLRWTAPADEGDSEPRVASYEVRYSTDLILNEQGFAAATAVPNPPPPTIPGTPQILRVSGLEEETKYFFYMRAADYSGNLAALSNAAWLVVPGSPPAPVADLGGIVGPGQVELRWTAPADVGSSVRRVTAYDCRYSRDRIEDASFSAALPLPNPPVPAEPGTMEVLRVTGLGERMKYWFAVRSADQGNRFSRISNVYEATTPLVPPDSVGDLEVSETAGIARLRWTVPSDHGSDDPSLARYDLRVAPAPITRSTFAAATVVPGAPVPGRAGSTDSVNVQLEESTEAWFAIRVIDPRGAVSLVSNTIRVFPGPIPPAAVTDLVVRAESDTAVLLEWTATGDDGRRGRPASYLLYSGEPPAPGDVLTGKPWKVLPALRDAGGHEKARVGVQPGKRTWFVLVAVDDRGLRSAPSNAGVIRSGPLLGRGGIAIAAAAQPARPPLDLHWQLGPDDPSSATIEIVDVAGRVVSRIDTGAAREGVWRWDGRGSGSAVSAGVYFARLAAGRRVASARVVVVW